MSHWLLFVLIFTYSGGLSETSPPLVPVLGYLVPRWLCCLGQVGASLLEEVLLG